MRKYSSSLKNRLGFFLDKNSVLAMPSHSIKLHNYKTHSSAYLLVVYVAGQQLESLQKMHRHYSPSYCQKMKSLQSLHLLWKLWKWKES